MQLLDDRHDDACAVANQRFDNVRADGVLTEEPRQRALNRVALEPPKHPGQSRQTIASGGGDTTSPIPASRWNRAKIRLSIRASTG